jgi:hypothetical protein
MMGLAKMFIFYHIGFLLDKNRSTEAQYTSNGFASKQIYQAVAVVPATITLLTPTVLYGKGTQIYTSW